MALSLKQLREKFSAYTGTTIWSNEIGNLKLLTEVVRFPGHEPIPAFVNFGNGKLMLIGLIHDYILKQIEEDKKFTVGQLKILKTTPKDYTYTFLGDVKEGTIFLIEETPYMVVGMIDEEHKYIGKFVINLTKPDTVTEHYSQYSSKPVCVANITITIED